MVLSSPRRGADGAEEAERRGRHHLHCSAVSWVKQSGFLCTDMAQRKMQEKGKKGWKRQARRHETPWCLGT